MDAVNEDKNKKVNKTNQNKRVKNKCNQHKKRVVPLSDCKR